MEPDSVQNLLTSRLLHKNVTIKIYKNIVLLVFYGWWEDNIKLDLREIGIDEANWIQLAQDRVQWRTFVNTVMNLRVP
jgi:hypothetical protein